LSIFRRSRKKAELDGKSKAIAVMYLARMRNSLQEELEETENGSDSSFGIKYDMNCLDKTIKYLEGNLYDSSTSDRWK
jgi:hypothetical protein